MKLRIAAIDDFVSNTTQYFIKIYNGKDVFTATGEDGELLMFDTPEAAKQKIQEMKQDVQ